MDKTHFIGFSFEFSGFYYTSNFLRILRILLHLKQLSYDTNPHKGLEKSPFSRNLVTAERKRREQDGVMWTKDNKRSDAHYIAWINLIQSNTSDAHYIAWINRIQSNTTHCAHVGAEKLHWCLIRSSDRPRPLWGLFLWRFEKTEGRGIHESTPQPRGKNTVKRNSERRIPRMSSENQRVFTGANLVVIQTGSWTGVCKVSRLCHWY